MAYSRNYNYSSKSSYRKKKTKRKYIVIKLHY